MIIYAIFCGVKHSTCSKNINKFFILKGAEPHSLPCQHQNTNFNINQEIQRASRATIDST